MTMQYCHYELTGTDWKIAAQVHPESRLIIEGYVDYRELTRCVHELGESYLFLETLWLACQNRK